MYRSTFGGMNTALRGLLAQQAAMDVTGHNLANINTEGYSRQRAELSATTPYTLPAMNRVIPSQIGTGVQVASFERLRDQFVDSNLRNQFGSLSNSNRALQNLEQMEGAFGEPGAGGLSNLLQSFWSAMDDVAANPQSAAARTAFVQSADALARGFNAVGRNLQDIQNQASARVDSEIIEVNNLTTQIASLNTAVRDALAMGQQPNDLLDQRDALMDQLSDRLNYTYTTAATGEVTIQFGTTIPIMLVDPLVPPGSTPLTRADLDPPNAYVNGDLTSGSLFADMDVIQNIVPNIYMANMDALAADLVTDLNTAHAAGFDLAGAAGLSMFNPIGTSALSMAVDAGLLANPSLLAAASSWAGTGEPGNGTNINNMLAQRAVAQGAPLNASWDNYYASTVADLGTRIQTTQRTIATQEAVVSVLEGRRNEVSGVSLDEEMSNMMRFQNAYNASARVLTAMDDALDTLINRMGRVGL